MNNKEFDLKKRTNTFAHRCVKLSLALPNNKLGNHIQGQLVRACTSVAANYRAACIAQSKKSFAAKISIVFEESDECCFWLEFIIEEKLLKQLLVSNLLAEAKELTSIFAASRITVKKQK